MFNRKFKLVGYAVGLVAVSVLVLALSGVTQGYPGDVCPPGPMPCIGSMAQDNPLARHNIVKMLQNQFAGFTASTEDLLNFEEAVFWSDGGPRLIAYIPPHPASEFVPRLRKLLAGEEVEVPVGGFYIAEDATGLVPSGAYKIRLRGEKAVLINSAGEEVTMLKASVDKSKLGQIPEKVQKIPFALTIVNNWCGSVSIGWSALRLEYHS